MLDTLFLHYNLSIMLQLQKEDKQINRLLFSYINNLEAVIKKLSPTKSCHLFSAALQNLKSWQKSWQWSNKNAIIIMYDFGWNAWKITTSWNDAIKTMIRNTQQLQLIMQYTTATALLLNYWVIKTVKMNSFYTEWHTDIALLNTIWKHPILLSHPENCDITDLKTPYTLSQSFSRRDKV